MATISVSLETDTLVRLEALGGNRSDHIELALKNYLKKKTGEHK